MDIFIKMCFKAWEVQRKWTIQQNGDRFYDFRCNEVQIYTDLIAQEGPIDGYGDYIDPEFVVFLPYQHQLQEMMLGESICSVDRGFSEALIIEFFHWFIDEDIDVKWTMEQLWLAFVMWKLYNKRWNGEDWVER